MNDEHKQHYIDKWKKDKHITVKHNQFEWLDSYLDKPPRTLLDIGCGHAHIARFFQEKYGTELYLLDGDVSTTLDRSRTARFGSVDDFSFYSTVNELKTVWDSWGMNYHFVDANDPCIPSDVRFDLITSWVSCGFHYPYDTYHDLIVRHTDPGSVVIMDFRRKSIPKQMGNFDIVEVLRGDASSKKNTLRIQPHRNPKLL